MKGKTDGSGNDSSLPDETSSQDRAAEVDEQLSGDEEQCTTERVESEKEKFLRSEIDGLLEELREAIEEDRHAQRFPYVFRSHRGKKGQKAASQNRALIQEARKRREFQS